MEEWKDIKGFEGLYMVSNLGRVKSLNYRRTGKEKTLKARVTGDGYLLVGLHKNNKTKQYLVHRLVAQAFLENPDNLPEVNHKDEDKTNNCADNLEYCSRSYNITYNGRAKKVAEKNVNNPRKSKPVIGINKVSGLIVEFPSINEASRQTVISLGGICDCCKGKRKSIKGYVWFYADDNE